MPMVPELAMTMLACARIGAVHSVVFAGFSLEALSQRIIAAKSKVLVTANQGKRGGKSIPLFDIVNKARALHDTKDYLQNVFVWDHSLYGQPLSSDHDFVLHNKKDVFLLRDAFKLPPNVSAGGSDLVL
jgi:acyl-coenzyme A synthetase/AMP-(fatty) acid ligase